MKSVRSIIGGTLVAAFAVTGIGAAAHSIDQSATPAQPNTHSRILADNCDPSDPPPRWACGAY